MESWRKWLCPWDHQTPHLLHHRQCAWPLLSEFWLNDHRKGFDRIDANVPSTFCEVACISVASNLTQSTVLSNPHVSWIYCCDCWIKIFVIPFFVGKELWNSQRSYMIWIPSINFVTILARACQRRLPWQHPPPSAGTSLSAACMDNDLALHCPSPAWYSSLSSCSCWAFKLIAYTPCTSFFRNEIFCWSASMVWSWSQDSMHCFVRLRLFSFAGLCCQLWTWSVAGDNNTWLLHQSISSSVLYSILAGSSESFACLPTIRPTHIRFYYSSFLLLSLVFSRYISTLWSFEANDAFIIIVIGIKVIVFFFIITLIMTILAHPNSKQMQQKILPEIYARNVQDQWVVNVQNFELQCFGRGHLKCFGGKNSNVMDFKVSKSNLFFIICIMHDQVLVMRSSTCYTTCIELLL